MPKANSETAAVLCLGIADLVIGTIGTRIKLEIDAFSVLQGAKRLAKAMAFRLECIGWFRIEGEHIKVMGNDEPGFNRFCEPGSFNSVKVAGDSAFGFVAVNGKQRNINS